MEEYAAYWGYQPGINSYPPRYGRNILIGRHAAVKNCGYQSTRYVLVDSDLAWNTTKGQPAAPFCCRKQRALNVILRNLAVWLLDELCWLPTRLCSAAVSYQGYTEQAT
jgi:hypothetical protein